MFPKIGVPQNGWFIMENPIKMADLGGTIIFGNTHVNLPGFITQNPRQQRFSFSNLRWVYTGFKLFGADVRASYFLTKRVFKGVATKTTKSWGLKVVLVDFQNSDRDWDDVTYVTFFLVGGNFKYFFYFHPENWGR